MAFIQHVDVVSQYQYHDLFFRVGFSHVAPGILGNGCSFEGVAFKLLPNCYHSFS